MSARSNSLSPSTKMMLKAIDEADKRRAKAIADAHAEDRAKRKAKVIKGRPTTPESQKSLTPPTPTPSPSPPKKKKKKKKKKKTNNSTAQGVRTRRKTRKTKRRRTKRRKTKRRRTKRRR